MPRSKKKVRSVRKDTIDLWVKVSGDLKLRVRLLASRRIAEPLCIMARVWTEKDKKPDFVYSRVLRREHPMGIIFRKVQESVLLELRGNTIMMDVGDGRVYLRSDQALDFERMKTLLVLEETSAKRA